MKMKFNSVAFFIFLSLQSVHAQQVVQLDSKGSEHWNWSEKEIAGNNGQRIVYNVSQPTLTVFRPDSVAPNGTAIIICPGGAFQFLAIDNGGYSVAHWLNKKGITAFVLKYRLAHTYSNDPFKELGAKRPNSKAFNEGIRPIVAMDIADGETAIAYLRHHASEYNIDSDRIGIIGFSAGGTLAAGVAYNYSADNRPDFVAAIYPYFGSFKKNRIQKNAPPLFIAAASDDEFGFNIGSVDFYKEWIASGHSAELHIFSKGGHGFGMRRQGLTSDTWIDRFCDWLGQLGFLNSKEE